MVSTQASRRCWVARWPRHDHRSTGRSLRWRLLREVCHSLAHGYPERPELQAAALMRLVGGARELLLISAAAHAFAGVRLPS